MNPEDLCNPCACYLYYLRQQQQQQQICSETECYTPETLPGPSMDTDTDPNSFMMLIMFAVLGMMFYLFRPQALRLLRGDAKDADSDSDSNGEPPLPPPAVN